MYNNFELKIDSIDRFMGYNSSTYKSVYMVTKTLPKMDEEKKSIGRSRKNKIKKFLFFLISRLFVNISLSQIKTTKQFQIILIKDPQKNFYSYNSFISVLDSLNDLEKIITKVLTTNTISKVLNYNPEIPFNIADFEYVQNNSDDKYSFITQEIIKLYDLFEKTNYQHEIKDKKEKEKLDSLLKDKDLIKNFFKAFILNRPKFKKRRTIKKFYKVIRRGEIIRLISFVIRKLVRRRRYLWRHVNIILNRDNKLILIGKDYKIYKKKIARTYISQESKYFVNFRKKKRLNAKYIKCVELLFKKPFLKEFKRFFKYIIHINKMLYYFMNRFPSLLNRYSSQLSDKKFAIPLKGKIRSFKEIMSRFLSVNKKGKNKLMLSILLMRKHQVEKHLLKSLRKKKEKPLEKFIKIMEREKYYPKHRRTQIPLRIKKWLMKHVYDDMALEFRESYSRPRVIIEKREELVESTYPYLPRDPLRFQRDVERDQFKRNKPLKFRIIKLTRPKVILQSNYFNYYKTGKYISKNLLKTKLNSKVHLPERIQRILRGCQFFYKNLLKGNSYQHFLTLIKKFKLLYLYKPQLKNKINMFI